MKYGVYGYECVSRRCLQKSSRQQVEMLNSNLFLRRDRGKRRGRGKFAPRDAPRESNNWSFQFLALRLTPDASPSIALVRRLVQPVYSVYMYTHINGYGLRHRRHILNANTRQSIRRPVNRVSRSEVMERRARAMCGVLLRS